MAIIPILQYPHPRLDIKAIPVTDVKNPDIHKIIADMLDTLAHSPNCAALAATQLDIIDPPAITVLNSIPPYSQKPFCLINPQIIFASQIMISADEGCMSIYPNELNCQLKRAKTVTVQALNAAGDAVIIEAEDFFARCLQHEIDHLNGILYIDRLSELKKNRLLSKVKKLTMVARG